MAESDRLIDEIRRLVVERLELPMAGSEIDPDAAFDAEMGLDSAAMLELVVGLEEAFEIDLELASVQPEDFRDVRSLARYLESRL